MKKKIRTVIFLLGSTLLNLIILTALATFFLLFFSFLFRDLDKVSGALSFLVVVVTLLGSISGTFFLYSRIMKWATKKWDIENNIESLFRSNQRHF